MYQLRRQRGLTQKQVAEIVGITQSAYAMIERGQRLPRKETMIKLARFFAMTIDELFFSNDYREE
jgi:DNA-binding XRE family transcriptional regulator